MTQVKAGFRGSVKLICVGRKQYPKGVVAEYPWDTGIRQRHDEIWYVFNGECQIRMEVGEWVAVRSGKLLWFPAGVYCEFRQNPDSPVGVNFFQFSRGFREEFSPTELNRYILDVTDPSFLESLSRRVIELYWEVYHEKVVLGGEQPDPSRIPCPQFLEEPSNVREDVFLPQTMRVMVPSDSGSEVTDLAYSLFMCLVREFLHLSAKKLSIDEVGIQRYHRNLVDDLVVEIQERLEDGVGVGELASSRGYSVDHLGRVFRKVMGCGIQSFLIKSRIARGRQLLLGSDLSVKEVSARLGYSNPFYFSRQFKMTVGLSPIAFREKYGPSSSRKGP